MKSCQPKVIISMSDNYYQLLCGTVLLVLVCGSLAASIVCPVTEDGTAQFVSDIDRRCTRCSLGVCKTFLPLPQECLCQCVQDYPGGTYSLEQRTLCHLVTSSTKSPPDQNPAEGFNSNNKVWIVVAVVSGTFIILGLAIYCIRRYCRHHRSNSIEENKWPLENKSLVDHESLLVLRSENSLPVKSASAAGSQNKIPLQETAPPKTFDESETRESTCSTHKLGIPEQGPAHPSELVPPN